MLLWIILPKPESSDSEEEVTPETVDIGVIVLDDTDEPIEGAIVTIGDVTCSNGTGSAGGCTLKDVSIGEGVTVSVTAEGYSEYSDTIDITLDTTSLIINLEEDVQVLTVRFIVTDNLISPIADAEVTVDNTYTGLTDANGVFEVELPVQDAYEVTVTAESYETYNSIESVSGEGDVTIMMQALADGG